MDGKLSKLGLPSRLPMPATYRPKPPEPVRALRRSVSMSDMRAVLPKPLKPLEVKVRFVAPSRTAKANVPATIPETIVPQPVKRVLRRSRSFSDLRNMPQLKPTLKPAPSTSSLKSKVTIGKRRVETTTSNEPKPKITKTSAAPEKPKPKEPTKPAPAKPRIPPYDFKARYKNLLEIHQAFKQKHTDCEGTAEKYQEASGRCAQLEEETEKLKSEVKHVGRLEKEVTDYRNKNRDLEIKNRELLIVYEELKKVFEETKSINEVIRTENSETKLKNEALTEQLHKAQTQNRFLHNEVQNLKGNIRVFCRVRPALASEEGRPLCAMSYYADLLEVRTPRLGTNGGRVPPVQEFAYDAVFPPNVGQKAVFAELDMLVQSAVDGYHVCVFAYGQTGSGKTYTMEGDGQYENRGMIQRSIESLFRRISELELSGWRYSVRASFLEVYNESIKDLLDPLSSKPLGVKFNEGRDVTVSNLTLKPIESEQTLLDLIEVAGRNRSVAVTNYNEHSSRSHAVTKIYVTGENPELGEELHGSINLVDLAGSESAKKSNAEHITETKHINTSLSALGAVILALQNGDQHVPFRNSKLTSLLRSCLEGNSKTLMFVNVAPFEECYSETINALRFATNVKAVKISARKNKKLLF